MVRVTVLRAFAQGQKASELHVLGQTQKFLHAFGVETQHRHRVVAETTGGQHKKTEGDIGLGQTPLTTLRHLLGSVRLTAA